MSAPACGCGRKKSWLWVLIRDRIEAGWGDSVVVLLEMVSGRSWTMNWSLG